MGCDKIFLFLSQPFCYTTKSKSFKNDLPNGGGEVKTSFNILLPNNTYFAKYTI